MTSRSPKSRRTTAWAITGPATATSLLAVLLAATGSAQTPGAPGTPVPAPPPAATPGVPAKTTWQPFPPSALGDMPSAPPLVLPSPTTAPVPTFAPPAVAPTLTPPTISLPPVPPVTAPPAVAVPPLTAPVPATEPPIGTRVVIYQKPAGGDRALTAQDEPKKEEDPKKDDLPKPKVPKVAAPPIPDPKPSEIRLLDDPLLDAEILRTHNAKQLEMYNRKKDPDRTKPKPMTTEQLPPSEGVRRMLAATESATAPRSTLGAAPSSVVLEPGYVVHRRLYFEEKNAERYGWNLGIAQPFISAGYFYKDLLLYPMKLASNHQERYDTNAGKAMAGSPVPYLHYPPELTFGGMVIGSTAIVGTVFLLP